MFDTFKVMGLFHLQHYRILNEESFCTVLKSVQHVYPDHNACDCNQYASCKLDPVADALILWAGAGAVLHLLEGSALGIAGKVGKFFKNKVKEIGSWILKNSRTILKAKNSSLKTFSQPLTSFHLQLWHSAEEAIQKLFAGVVGAGLKEAERKIAEVLIEMAMVSRS